MVLLGPRWEANTLAAGNKAQAQHSSATRCDCRVATNGGQCVLPRWRQRGRQDPTAQRLWLSPEAVHPDAPSQETSPVPTWPRVINKYARTRSKQDTGKVTFLCLGFPQSLAFLR